MEDEIEVYDEWAEDAYDRWVENSMDSLYVDLKEVISRHNTGFYEDKGKLFAHSLSCLKSLTGEHFDPVAQKRIYDLEKDLKEKTEQFEMLSLSILSDEVRKDVFQR